MRHYAAQVKHEARISQGTSVDGLLSQVRQAFAKPFKRPDSPRECHVSAVYIFNSGEITPNAREQLLTELEREHYGDNVHFLAGERLEALNEWATLGTDGNARTRLLGLLRGLGVIIHLLKRFEPEGKPSFQPFFIQGIELYLSEPVNSDDQMIQSLLELWQRLQVLEALNRGLLPLVGRRTPQAKDLLERNSQRLKDIAKDALSRAIEIEKIVDAVIGKMKPLGGS
jgi:hypothetical protein